MRVMKQFVRQHEFEAESRKFSTALADFYNKEMIEFSTALAKALW